MVVLFDDENYIGHISVYFFCVVLFAEPHAGLCVAIRIPRKPAA
jgi:hypothetical protein